MEPYVSKTDQEIKDLALSVFRREVFISDILPPNQANELVPRVFLPVANLGDEDVAFMKQNKITLFYAHMSDALSLNFRYKDWPLFRAFQMLNSVDHSRLLNEYVSLLEASGQLDGRPSLMQRIKGLFRPRPCRS